MRRWFNGGWNGRLSLAGGCAALAALGCTSNKVGEATAVARAPLTLPGLVAAYSFDEASGSTVTDLSGNGNDGTISGAAWGAGIHGTGLTFDGQDDWVTVPDSDSLDLSTGMTIEAWVRPTARLGYETLIMKEGDTSPAYTLFAAEDAFGDPAHREAGVVVPGCAAGSGYNLQLNTWSHVAATYDGSSLTLYVNQDRRTLNDFSAPLPATTGPLRIGGNSLTGAFLQGSVDEVRIYNRGLSWDEINADMDEPVVNFTPESNPPSVAISSPSSGATLSGSVTVTTNASDDQALAGVRLLVDDKEFGPQVTAPPYNLDFDTTRFGNGSHTISALARDVAGNTTTTDDLAVTINNPTNGLVAAYAFDEGAGAAIADASSFHNDGTLVDGQWSSGKYGGALSFDGVDDAVMIADAPSLDLTIGLTLEAWVQPASSNPWPGVIVKQGGAGNASYSLYSSDDNGFAAARIQGVDDEFGVGEGYLQLPLGEWSHLAAVFDGTSQAIYINGQFLGFNADPGVIKSSTDPLWLGRDPEGNAYAGLIDDVRIYNRPLSNDEIDLDMTTPVGCAKLDDGNPCTLDACDPVTGSATHTPLAVGASCSDGNVCNGTETCDASATCVAGAPPSLDDGDPCTTDACSPATGITHTFAAGPSCSGLVAAYSFDDGTGVLATDASASGNDGTLSDGVSWITSGKHGGAASFSSGWVTVNENSTVDLTSGMTLEAWVNPNTPPGFTVVAAKETPDAIAYGLYAGDTDGGGDEVPHPAGWVLTANGLNGTFTDSVLPTNTWTHIAATYDESTLSYYINGVLAASTSVTGPIGIGDGPFRIGGDAPYGGEYFDGLIDDVRVYRYALSADQIGSDMVTPVGSSSSDCSGVNIDDGNPCTVDACDPATGNVTHTPVAVGTSCSDGNACNGTETCNASAVCVAGTPPTLDDGNPCTTDACDASAGVTHTPVAAGTSCSDGNQCNGTETCNASAACVAGTPPTVDDGNPCTADACDPVAGVTHTPVAAGTSCSDGNACNGAETCNASAACVAGTPPSVDDGNPCTVDACNPSTGVTHTPVAAGTSCSDGNACNGAETCNSSAACVAGTPPTVDDGNPCTADACNPSSGVTHTPVATGTSCSDGNVCNGAETCNASAACVAGTPPTIDDGNPCTDDTCSPTAGVSHTPRAAGASCSDFDLCNGNETCDGSGSCKPGTPVAIDTTNPCRAGTCDPATGVVSYTPRPQGTTCPIDICNSGACNSTGECTASGSTVSDDGNDCTLEWCDPVRGPQQATCSTLDRTVGTTLNGSMKWLYSGTNPIQQGVAAGTIQVEQSVALRGRVTTRDGGPLAGVTVSVLGRPEFGHTLTQSNGYFDMVVNGGGTLIIDYQRTGYLRVQRPISSQWNDYAALPDIIMIPPDPVATTLNTSGSGDIQLAQSTIQTDDSGTRQGVLLVPAGTQATMHMPDGSVQPLDSMNVRITEFTVGPDGDKAMPGSLPGESKYTYAFDVNADEAVAANATSITFDAPVVYYTDNFLHFPAGTTVPLGFFDATASAWKAADSGVVIDVVGVSGGRVQLDVTGDDVADPPSQLATFGITDAELQKMAGVYAPGRTLWRVQLPHFTPWDENWGGGPPPDATGPNATPPTGDPTPTCQSGVQGNSIIECESQVLRETVPIAGTPYTLNYSSERTPGRLASNRLTIPLSGPTIPQSLERIDLDVTVAGVTHHQTFPASANETTTFDWDGLDAFQRQPQGTQIAQVKIGYVYRYVYSQTDRFGNNGNGLSISVQTVNVQPPPGSFPSYCLEGGCNALSAYTRQDISVSQTYSVPVGGLDARALGLGGWTLDVQHVNELLPQRLELGTGERVEVSSLPPAFDLAAQGTVDTGSDLVGSEFVVGPDKAMYFTSQLSGRIYKATPGQAPVLFAGNGTTNYNGDNLPATSAGFAVNDLALGRDGTLYFADGTNQIVRKIGADGLVKTIGGVAGARSIESDFCTIIPDEPGPCIYCQLGAGCVCPQGSTCQYVLASGGPATETPMADPEALAVSPDGSVYVSTNSNIMKITTDGKLTTYAGPTRTSVFNRASASPPDGLASQSLINPRGLAVAPDGTLYAILSGANQDGSVIDPIGTVIVKFVDGGMKRVAGDGCVIGCQPAWRDNAPALTSHMRPTGLAFDTNGLLYIADTAIDNDSGGFTRVATLTGDGLLEAAAGLPQIFGGPAVATGLPAKNAQLVEQSTRFIAMGPNGLYIRNGSSGSQAFHIGVPLPHDTGTGSVVGSPDSDAYFVFDDFGRHLATKNSLTGAALVQFGYDANGNVVTITDASGNVTTVTRDAAGTPVAFVAPFGQQTNLSLDTNGYLQSVTDPAGNSYGMAYQNGLLTSFTNARGFTSTMQYDALGRLHVDSDSVGGSQTVSRTDNGLDWTVDRTTALGHVTSYETEVHEDGHQIRRVVPPDNTQSVTTTGADRITQLVSRDGTVTTTTEMPDARFGLSTPIVSRTTQLPSGLTSSAATTRSYVNLDPNNILSFDYRRDRTTVNGNGWNTLYSSSARSYQTTTPSNRSYTRTVDNLGRPITTQLAGLAPVSFFYDSNGRLDHATQSSGAFTRTVSYGYVSSGPSKGYILSITDPLSDAMTYTSDALGRTLTETRAGVSTAFTWDGEDELTSVTPPGKPAHGMTYTPVNLLETYAPPTAGLPLASTSYSYDADRMLRTEARPDGVQIVLTPDSTGRLSTVQIPGGMLQYSYYPAGTASGAGQTSDILGPYGTNLHFTYDGSLMTSTASSGDVNSSVSFSYNNDFNKVVETINTGTASAQTAFGYDSDQLLTCASPTTCSPPGSDALTLARNSAGLVGTIALGNTSETVAYNAFGELARQTATFAPNKPLVDITYDVAGLERDNLGRIAQKTEVIAGATNVYRYTYDHLRRLTDVKLNGSLAEHFEYDANGNRTLGANTAAGTSYTGTYDDQDRLLSYGPFDFTYTANGELETKKNRTTGEEWIFAYDPLGNLLSVGLPSGDLVEYLVDGLGRRVGKKKNGTLLKQWLYHDALKPVAELDGSGNLVSQFVYGSKSNVPDYVRRGGATYRVISDQLGSPRYVVNVANASDVPFTATYTSFGVVTGAGLDWMPFGLAGGLYDTDTDLIRFGARDYIPTVGRFAAKDPLVFAGGDTTLYGYCANDPIDCIDPTGLYSGVDDAVFAAGGALVGIASQAFGDLLSGQVSGWQDYASAGLGGAAGGVALLYMGPAGAGAIGGAVQNASKQGLNYLTGRQCHFHAMSLLADTAIGGATGFLVPGIKIPGLTAGRNSANSIFKQMVTKFENGTINNVSLQTAGKMFAGAAVDTSLLPGAALGTAAGVANGSYWDEPP